MNITFLLGNGFDIGLGMKSGYKNFYPYFIEKSSNDNMIKKEIEADKKEDYPNWSDLEIALGKFTKNVSKETLSQFIKDKVELDTLLKQYLKNEEEKFKYDGVQIKTMVKKVLEHLRSGNSVNEKEQIGKTIDFYKEEEYLYQCITFNYTKCPDLIWKEISKEIVGHHTYRGNNKNERFDKVLHIHGTLGDNEMLIGVNDESQIENTELLDNEYLKWVMIKPYLNTAIGQRKTERAKEIINKSGIICLYGLSVGMTDKMWWEYIGEWLKNSTNRLLIIYNYEPEYVPGHPVTRLMHVDGIRNDFLGKTKLNEKERENVKSRVIIYDNQNVFSLQ